MPADAITDERAAVAAARLVLPEDALATGVTGLRLFGVDAGTAAPLRSVTAARARHPRRVVERVHAMLVEAGYDGPAPVLDARWRALFGSLRADGGLDAS